MQTANGRLLESSRDSTQEERDKDGVSETSHPQTLHTIHAILGGHPDLQDKFSQTTRSCGGEGGRITMVFFSLFSYRKSRTLPNDPFLHILLNMWNKVM